MSSYQDSLTLEDAFDPREDGVEILAPGSYRSAICTKTRAALLLSSMIILGTLLVTTTQRSRASYSSALRSSFSALESDEAAIVVPWGIYKHTTSLPSGGADAAKEWLENYLTGLTDQYTLGCYPSSKVVGEIVFVVALLLRCTCCTVTAIVVSTKRPLTLFPNFSSTRKAATS
jgi:hypothetical protein